uniref:ParB-like N-terminal domain-containing protein n=1 Tax=Ralstonia solanacearum TaxID=305 RepID=A0A0S4XD46_RALSL|nr:conserved protein of unknown function [Ralstonia solanacearum]CUV34248.1 conserved protein of unknown function [Ralstonia solanacearum]CUV38251.1 conserved protein of unknown function [Ralstonia solanacearum]CUV62057.1 conserved protein of unknown function [Ralstonia solanacearum]
MDSLPCGPLLFGNPKQNLPNVEYRQVAALIPYARNPRTHSDEQVARIAASIVEYGWTNPVLVDGENGVIAGHGRLAAAGKLGMDEVPVIELAHLSPTQKRALILADNRIALDAGWDDELLALEFAELADAGYDLALTGFNDAEIDALLADELCDVEGDGQAEESVLPEVPEEAISRPGDVWVLGRHRLLCGDATVAENYDRLLQGEPADMVFADPPYNVN